MKNNKSLIAVLTLCGVLCCSDSSYALPTFDAASMGAQSTYVHQTGQEVKNQYDQIMATTQQNTAIGDSAGTLSKIKSKKSALEKAKTAFAEGKKRVTAGIKAYQEYSKEIETRKQQYQELMDALEAKSGDAYDDSDEDYDDYEDYAEYEADYDANYEEDYDEDTISTIQIAEEELQKQKLEAESSEDVISMCQNLLNQQSNDEANYTPAYNPDAAQVDTIPENFETPVFKPVSRMNKNLRAPINDNIQSDEETEDEESEEDSADEEESAEKAEVESSAPRRLNFRADKKGVSEGVVRNKFTSAPLKNAKVPAASASEKSVNTEDENLSTGKGISKLPAVERKFRVSPRDKLSSSTVGYRQTVMFADEVGAGGSSAGSNYDENGVFITSLAQRCGMSINDLINAEKATECINKVIAENNSDNAYDAENSRKDCKKMIYQTLIAISAEAIKLKDEAAKYGETIEKMEEQAAESSDERDDMAVVAAYNAEMQKLLNKMSQLISGQILLDSTKQICGTSKDVLGKTDSNDGAK